MYVVDFEHRSDGGPMLCGPFGSKTAAHEWAVLECPGAVWAVRAMHVPECAAVR